MKIQEVYSDPMDSLRSPDHLYESLEELQLSQGSLNNILGSATQKPPLAPTPVLKRRKPLVEREHP